MLIALRGAMEAGRGDGGVDRGCMGSKKEEEEGGGGKV